VPTLQDWIDHAVERMEVRISTSIPRTPDSPLYALALMVADVASNAVTLILGMADGIDPNAAVGEALDLIARFNSVTRLGAEPSTVMLTLTGTNGTVVPAGTRFASSGGAIVFELDAATTISGATSAPATCTVDGATELAAATTMNIQTPVAGLASAITADAASPGRGIETDAQLRGRMFVARFLLGRGTENAIRGALLAVPGVTAAVVVSNRTGSVDSEGRPAHSFECVVLPDTVEEELIGAVLLAQQPAGVETHGRESWSTVDESGTARTVRWNFGAEVAVEVRAQAVTVASGAPPDWDAQIVAALTAYIDGLALGEDVRYVRLVGIFGGFSWVTGGTVQARLSPAGSWAAADVAMDYDQKATPATNGVTATA